MSSAWDFIGGFSDATLDTIKQRESAAADINKMKMLEQLRRETSDYEYKRNKADEEKKVDVRQSYLDGDTFVMVNSEGKVINRRPATSSEKLAEEAGKLDVDYKRAQIDNFAIDNARADRALSIQERGLSARQSLDGGKEGKLYSIAQHVIKDIAELGLDPNSLARVQSDLYTGISSGKYNESDIRKYQATFMAKAHENNLTGKFSQANADERARAAMLEAKRKKALGL